MLGAKGGGKDMSAQATGNNPSGVPQAMVAATKYASDKLGLSLAASAGCSSDLNTDASLGHINTHMADRSYVQGYQPSQADTVLFESLGSQPQSSYIHLSRWYRHISSYGKDRSMFPGTKCTMEQLGLLPATTIKKDKSDSDDDDIDLFGSDDEDDEEAEKLKAERVAAYQAKKSNKPTVIAKSSIVLDVKPWDDETDMAEMEKCVRSLSMPGLLWGASKLVAVGYGIKKLQISCVVEDDKVSVDSLEESITEFDDLVQSVDIASFNKI